MTLAEIPVRPSCALPRLHPHASSEDIVSALDRAGCVVVERALAPALLATIGTELDPWFEKALYGDGYFFGRHTKRFSGIFAKTRSTAALALHDAILPAIERYLLGPAEAPLGDCVQLHLTQAIEIGEGVQNAQKFGSEVHDEIYFDENNFKRRTNRAGGLEGGITNGEELRVRGYLKPISTLRKPLHSVDIDTKKDDLAAFERSDITAVPAAGVIGEAMLAIVLANSMREKFGGDSMAEMKQNFDNYTEKLRKY